MTTKSIAKDSQIKLSRPASVKLVGLLKKPQTKVQKEAVAQAKGTYSYYREKWIQTQ